jgi:putative membrane protein
MNKNLRTAIIVGGVVLAILIVVPLFWGSATGWQGRGWGMMGPGMMGLGMMSGFGFGWFMPVLMILFWGLVIWGVVALVRGLSGPDRYDSATADSALEILKRRYARGEVSKNEYEQKKRELT